MGIEKIGGHSSYAVVARRRGGGQARLFFDSQTGLLLWASERIESLLGALLQDAEYEDSRDVSGVKTPITVRMVRADTTTSGKRFRQKCQWKTAGSRSPRRRRRNHSVVAVDVWLNRVIVWSTGV